MIGVLIVDDSRPMRMKLKKMIEQSGYEVVAEAENGLAAFVAYEKYRPDIVTMDITMPVMDGITAVKKIIKKFPEATIIMTTSHGEKSMVFEAVQNGAKHYLIKPVTPEKIVEVFDKVLGVNKNKTSDSENTDTEPFLIERIQSFFCIQIRNSFKSKHLTKFTVDMEKLMLEIDLTVILDVSDIGPDTLTPLKNICDIMINIVEANGHVSIYAPNEDLRNTIFQLNENFKFITDDDIREIRKIKK
ncbi:MAG: response regulator [Desulfobacterales bacterium]|nr:response regulator [Desulfobacterales bacterium]